MRRERSTGEAASLLAALGALLLLISLFLTWYTLPGYTITAWTAFEVWDVVLAVIALAVLLSIATDLGWWRGPAHSVGLAPLGALAFVIVASQLIDRPPSALHSAVGTGGWLALVGAGAILVGAVLTESRVTVSFNRAGPATAPASSPAAARTTGRRRSRRDGVEATADPVVRGTATPAADPSDPDRTVALARDATDASASASVGDAGETIVAPTPPRQPRRPA